MTSFTTFPTLLDYGIFNTIASAFFPTMPTGKLKANEKKKVPQLNVRPFPADLLRTLNVLASAKEQSQGDFVIEALRKSVQPHQPVVDRLVQSLGDKKTG